MKPFLLGLTGSIGMGKSATAALFAAEGVPVWDADAAVHRLYGVGGAAVVPLAEICPDALRDGQIDRGALKAWMRADPTALSQIERLVHPLVAADRLAFIDREHAADLIVLDVPLLFETGTDAMMDANLVVSAPADVQRARVMARPGMTEALFETIRSKQMADCAKRARADFIIETHSPQGAAKAVRAVIDRIRKAKHA